MINLKNELSNVKTIGIGGHIRPDGDCVGSVMALFRYLKRMEPSFDVHVFLEEPAPVFDCIAGIECVEHVDNKELCCDVFFAIDCGKERLGFAEEIFDRAKKKINIDHHISNKGTGDVLYIEPKASSASELVFDLLDAKYIDVEIAKALYIGIIHDTGVMQYSNTSRKTLETVGKLIEYGFDFSKLIDETFYEKTYIQTQILGRALLESFVLMDGRIAVSAVDRKMMDFYRVTSQDLEGIVNQLRLIKGVDTAIFMYQTDSMEYKVSLRSNEKVDVAKVASVFNGGGHVRAAGCTVKGSFYDVVNNISEQISKQY